MMLTFLVCVLGSAMLIILIRAAKGPGWIDRVLAINAFGTLTALLLTVIAILSGLPGLLDISLLYVLINFTSTIAILRFFKDTKLPVFGRRPLK